MRKHSRICVLIILIFTAIWLTGCSGGSSLSAEITRGESRWQSQEIQNYVIEVSHTSGTWHHQTHKITVQNGEVVNSTATCVDAPMEIALEMTCEVQAYNPQDFTVPGLFILAWTHLEKFATQNIEIEFDPEYGYPSTIFYDDPEIIDEEQAWGVRSFEILEEGWSSLETDLTQAESLWQSKGIQSYDIEVSHGANLWHYQIHQISVRNGVVVDSSAKCVDTPMDTALGKTCEIESFNSSDFTVPGLFNRAWSLLRRFSDEAIYFEFDPDNGYPSKIRYDDPEMVDEDMGWGVRSFTIIED